MTHDTLCRCTVQKSGHAWLGHLIIHVNKTTAAGDMFHFDKVEQVHQRVLVGGCPSHRTAAADAGRLSLRFRRREHVIRVARTVVEISASRKKGLGEQ
jgi:hypothetical protein